MSAKQSYSQSGEDIIIDFLFQHVLNINSVRYLDIGSNDPMEFNNTFFFYKNGGRGICIDPNPYFKPLYKDSRPEDIFICAGIGSKQSKANFYIINPHTLSTFSKEEAERYTDNTGYTIEKVTKLPILTVGHILNKYSSKELPNLLSVDVEGLDIEILTSIDFTNWRPTVICAETLTHTNDAGEEKIGEIINFLQSNGYKIYADTYINTIFVDQNVWEART